MHAQEAAEANPQPHVVSRMTKGKRMLWYCLKVIQQPERARACGSGPKCESNYRGRIIIALVLTPIFSFCRSPSCGPASGCGAAYLRG